MTSTTDAIIAEVRAEVEGLLGIVTGPASERQSAGEVELALFRRLLRLGAMLLGLFFAARGAERPAGPVVSEDGTELRYHDRRRTSYFSIFGKLRIWRHAFTAPGQPVVCPLDAALGLPARCYSDVLREWATYGATDGAYRESQTMLERVLGLRLSVQAIETAMAEDAADVAAFLAEPRAASPEPPGRLLVVQADGKGVPMVPAETGAPVGQREVRRKRGQPRGIMREAIVTAVYTLDPTPRRPADVLASLLPLDPHAPSAPAERADRARPVGKELRATLDGKTAALTRLAARAAQDDGPHIRQRVALTDGADALQRALRAALPEYPLVLDIIHALEHLWEAATGLLGERHPERTAWVRDRLALLLEGHVLDVVADLRTLADGPTLSPTIRALLTRTASYYERNAPHMRYDAYLAAGWPIGTGVVEGACRHLVKDRIEQAGMRWTRSGAQALLDLRAVRLNGQWDAYWHFHRQQQHRRRHPFAPAADTPIDLQILDAAA
ncbi:MAG: ISKra4 family transposase [Chloroflexota bacterium]